MRFANEHLIIHGLAETIFSKKLSTWWCQYFFYKCIQCHKFWYIAVLLSRVPGHLHKQRVKGRLPYILLPCMEAMKLQESSSKMVAIYITKIKFMWNLNDVNIKYIPVPLSFCASGKANVNATDINGNNALHLCLMRRPAMMEFAKVSYNHWVCYPKHLLRDL